MTWNLSTVRVKDLDSNEKNDVIDLLICNMKALYEQSNWGWNEKNKRAEMLEDAAWYLLAKDEDGAICGFSHFRYDMDYDDEVLYVYEVCNVYFVVHISFIAQQHVRITLKSKLIEK